MPPDVVQRKVKSLLNKMTPQNFDKIVGQILEIAAQSRNETDGRTLRQVIQLTFEKACDEAHWAGMYAKFCDTMLSNMSADIKDDNVKDKNGNAVVGGALFRKYLLTRCQEEFERGWEVNLPEKPEGQTEEAAMLSDEYYVAAAAKRRGLGLIQFIGELYKLGMLTMRIMHECVLKLLHFEGMPDESAVESLTKLLRTVGSTMDQTETGSSMIEAYFERIKSVMKMQGLPSRLYYMLLDTIELRETHKWHSKQDAKGPKTITEIREEAAAQAAAQEAERLRSQARGPRGGSSMGGNRGGPGGFPMQPPPDYQRNTVGMDDLRKLGHRSQSRNVSGAPQMLGPSSMFAGRSGSGRNRTLGPQLGGRLGAAGADSADSSRMGTPPVPQKQDAVKEDKSSRANAFR